MLSCIFLVLRKAVLQLLTYWGMYWLPLLLLLHFYVDAAHCRNYFEGDDIYTEPSNRKSFLILKTCFKLTVSLWLPYYVKYISIVNTKIW